jgi:RNA polymerase sigma-70 factor, ECF subfamily
LLLGEDPGQKNLIIDESEGSMADPSVSFPEGREAQRLAAYDQHRGLLLSIAYRMLGSSADAEDMLQETFIRWQQAADADIHSPRAFLVTIISRLCINHLQSARVEREEYVGEWLPEPLVAGPLDTDLSGTARIDESLSMAFLVLLERLSPLERAIFLLREIFDYEYREIARILSQSEANCRQILHRARQHIAEVRPRFDASLQEREELLHTFLEATASGDFDALVSLLSSTVVFHSDGGGKAPALPNPIYGAQNVARAILGGIHKLAPKNLVRRMAQVNGQPGIVSYLDGRPYAVFTLHVERGLIQNLYIVTNPEKLARLQPLPEAPW